MASSLVMSGARSSHNIDSHTSPHNIDNSAKFVDDEIEIVEAEKSCIQEEIKKKIGEKREKIEETGLTMAEDKTEVLVIKSSRRTNNTNVPPKKQIKFLGYILQETLKVEEHVDMIVTRMRAAAARIWQYPQLDPGHKKILYHGWVQSN